jgi:hypothetical protein
MQVLSGDIKSAVHLHDYYWHVWRRFGALPERFDWQQQVRPALRWGETEGESEGEREREREREREKERERERERERD